MVNLRSRVRTWAAERVASQGRVARSRGLSATTPLAACRRVRFGACRGFSGVPEGGYVAPVCGAGAREVRCVPGLVDAVTSHGDQVSRAGSAPAGDTPSSVACVSPCIRTCTSNVRWSLRRYQPRLFASSPLVRSTIVVLRGVKSSGSAPLTFTVPTPGRYSACSPSRRMPSTSVQPFPRLWLRRRRRCSSSVGSWAGSSRAPSCDLFVRVPERTAPQGLRHTVYLHVVVAVSALGPVELQGVSRGEFVRGLRHVRNEPLHGEAWG